MVRIAKRITGFQAALQQMLPLDERHSAQVVAVAKRQVKQVIDYGSLPYQRWRGTDNVHARLQPLEIAASMLVQHYDFTIQHSLAGPKPARQLTEFGIRIRNHASGARSQFKLAVLDPSERPDSVPLNLKEPIGIRKGLFRDCGKHRLKDSRHLSLPRTFERVRTGFGGSKGRQFFLDFLERAPAEGRAIVLIDIPVCIDRSILVFDQQPRSLVFAALAGRSAGSDLDQHEATAQLFAVQRELQLATLQLLRNRQATFPFERAAVPHHHRTSAVLSLGYHPFKPAVIKRMVLSLHGEALIRGIERRTFRHGPRLQRAVNLEAEIVVQPGGVMLLNHEAIPAGRRPL